MKKMTVYVLVAFLLSTCIPFPTQGNAVTNPSPMTTGKTAEAEEAHVLLGRLNEINALDKSRLNSVEKKQLRKEVRAAKKRLRAISGGIYLSTAAVIIIILLLIILV